MRVANRIYVGLLALSGLVAGTTFGLIAVLVTVEVAIRNLGIGSMLWLTEAIEYALFVTSFAAAPWVLRQAGHVRVDLLLVGLRPARRRLLEYLVDLLGLAISLVFLWYGVAVTVDAYESNIVIYNQLATPEWLLFVVVPFASTLLAIEFALRIRRTYRTGEADLERHLRHGF